MLKKVLLFLAVLFTAIFVAQFQREDADKYAASRENEEHAPGARTQLAEKQRKEELPRANERLRQIQKELLSVGEHEWAGTYVWEDGQRITARLTLAPQAGFTFLRSSLAGIVDVNHGAIESVDEDHVQLELALDPDSGTKELYFGEELPLLAKSLCFVRWGARRYLIPTPQMQRFCNAVSDGSEARRASFPLRDDCDLHAPVEGLPQVPAVWQGFVLKHPLESWIAAIDAGEATAGARSRSLKLPRKVTVTAGSDRGLRKGMALWLVDQPAYAEGEVLEALADRASVQFRFAPEVVAEIEPLKVGMQVSTRRPVLAAPWDAVSIPKPR